MASWNVGYESVLATGRRVWSVKGTPAEEQHNASTAKRRERKERDQRFLESLMKKVDGMDSFIEQVTGTLAKKSQLKDYDHTVYVPGEVQYVEVPLVQVVYKTFKIPVYDVVTKLQNVTQQL